MVGTHKGVCCEMVTILTLGHLACEASADLTFLVVS